MQDIWRFNHFTHLTKARRWAKVRVFGGNSSSPSSRQMIAMLESVFLPFEARQLSAMFKAAPGSHCPPGIASLLVSRMQRGCWWKTRLSSSKTNWKYLWEKQTGIQVRLKRTTQTQSNIELSVNYFAAANLFDQNSVPPQLCFWFGW